MSCGRRRDFSRTTAHALEIKRDIYRQAVNVFVEDLDSAEVDIPSSSAYRRDPVRVMPKRQFQIALPQFHARILG